MHGHISSILLADDDEQRSSALAGQLTADGYTVELASAPREAELKLAANPPALLLCGRLGDPPAALALVGRIREGMLRPARVPAELPVVVFGGGDQLTTLRAFERGADDVVGQTGYLELRARIRALLRRAHGGLGAGDLTVDGVEINLAGRSAAVHGQALAVTRTEFELLGPPGGRPAGGGQQAPAAGRRVGDAGGRAYTNAGCHRLQVAAQAGQRRCRAHGGVLSRGGLLAVRSAAGDRAGGGAPCGVAADYGGPARCRGLDPFAGQRRQPGGHRSGADARAPRPPSGRR